MRVFSKDPDERPQMTFDEFVRTELPALLRFAKVLSVDRGTAEDVVQDVLVKAQARWADIAPRDQPAAYVRRMIVNEYLSWRRKWARVLPSYSISPDRVEPDVAVGIADRTALIAEIGRLPARQRAVVVMRYFADMTDAEIAADLGCGAGTVRSHVSRALAALRVQIGSSDEIGDVDERLAN